MNITDEYHQHPNHNKAVGGGHHSHNTYHHLLAITYQSDLHIIKDISHMHLTIRGLTS